MAQTLATRAFQAVNRVCLGKAKKVRFRSKASSPQAKGADTLGYRYSVQLILEGIPFQKSKHSPGSDQIGLDLGPSTIAIVPRESEARLVPLCEELQPDERMKRRLERKLAAHRKSLHGRLVREIIHIGNNIRIEKISYRGWKKQFGKSVGFRAPGMLIDRLRRTVASTGGTLTEFSTRLTKLSQYCHGCRKYAKKPLSQRWHQCACGVGPVQRDLYSAYLAAYLDLSDITPFSAQYHLYWESAGVGGEPRLRAALERLIQRAKEGQVLPRA